MKDETLITIVDHICATATAITVLILLSLGGCEIEFQDQPEEELAPYSDEDHLTPGGPSRVIEPLNFSK